MRKQVKSINVFGWLGSTSWHCIQKAVTASEVTDCRRPHSCCLLCHLFSDLLAENGTLTCGAFGVPREEKKKTLHFLSVASKVEATICSPLLLPLRGGMRLPLISPFSPSAGHVPTPTHVTHPDGLPPKPNGISPKANMSGVCAGALQVNNSRGLTADM